MTLNTYNSFDEIDERLKILRLQRKIRKESFKYNLHNAKTNFYPGQLVGGFSRLLQKIVLTFTIKKLSFIFRKRDRIKVLE